MKHDIGLSIDVQQQSGCDSGAKRRIYGPAKLLAGAANVLEGTYNNVSERCGEGEDATDNAQQVTFLWDNSYSRLNSKTVQFELEVVTPLGVAAKMRTRRPSAAAALPPPPSTLSETEPEPVAEESGGGSGSGSGSGWQRARSLSMGRRSFGSGRSSGSSSLLTFASSSLTANVFAVRAKLPSGTEGSDPIAAHFKKEMEVARQQVSVISARHSVVLSIRPFVCLRVCVSAACRLARF